MNQETKNCQNCKKDFTIEQEDFSFYEKIKVPPPTWCPECRMKRRMLHRNESVWYKRKCDATGEEMISMFAPEKPFTVYSQEYWKSDKWDPLSYGREYDFSRTFFEQFAELMKEVPFPNLIQKNVVNSKYTNYTLNQKNTYFVGGADMAEDCAYMFGSNIRVKDCFDTYRVGDLELCYGVVDCEKSSRLFFAQDCVGCANSALLYDCRNCVDCFGCVGLRNKQYYVFNQPYSKEEYKKKVDSLNINTASGLAEAQAEFEKRKLRTPRKFAWIVNSENVSGNDIVHAHNCHYCFSARNNVENCKYSYRILDCKDSYDVFVGWNGAELLYEVFSVSAQRVIGSALIWGGFDIRHSYNCFDCSNIFGCVGLRNKQYCVFNKQYSKEEYEKLAPRIIEQMSALPYTDAKGRIYGYSEFFPPELSLFAYNESVAQAYFPKTKDAVLKRAVSGATKIEKHITLRKQRKICLTILTRCQILSLER